MVRESGQRRHGINGGKKILGGVGDAAADQAPV